MGKETGIWVHHPGSKVSPTWESRKGRTRILENEIRNQQVAIFQSHQPSSPRNDEQSGTQKNHDDIGKMKTVHKGLNKTRSAFNKHFKDSCSIIRKETASSGCASEKEMAVRFIDELLNDQDGKRLKEDIVTPAVSVPEGKGKALEKATSLPKPAKRSRDFRKCQSDMRNAKAGKFSEETDSSDEDNVPPEQPVSITDQHS